MGLTLTLVNVDQLDNGETTRLVLDRHGALIGRSPNADWSLPDSKKHISSTHCEIVYRSGDYLLHDKSTNGTFLNGAKQRMDKPHKLQQGDEFVVGPYRIRAALTAGDARPAPPPQPTADDGCGWGDPAPKPEQSAWDDLPPAPGGAQAWPDEPARPSSQDWPDEPPAPAVSGTGPMAQNWTPPRPVAPADDVWNRYANASRVEWDAGFGAAPAAPQTGGGSDPWANFADGGAKSAAQGGGGSDQAWLALLAAAGVAPEKLTVPGPAAGRTAGAILRKAIAGIVMLLEARARAKAELGASATSIELGGNNPLKFLRAPEEALTRLLNPPERGYVDGVTAVEDGFKDLDAHQTATVAAMQRALRATIARFSPEAIRGRAEERGLLARIMPGTREATLWSAYEREFEGVVRGSDEAFMDVFAKAFREAYQEAVAALRK